MGMNGIGSTIMINSYPILLFLFGFPFILFFNALKGMPKIFPTIIILIIPRI